MSVLTSRRPVNQLASDLVSLSYLFVFSPRANFLCLPLTRTIFTCRRMNKGLGMFVYDKFTVRNY